MSAAGSRVHRLSAECTDAIARARASAETFVAGIEQTIAAIDRLTAALNQIRDQEDTP